MTQNNFLLFKIVTFNKLHSTNHWLEGLYVYLNVIELLKKNYISNDEMFCKYLSCYIIIEIGWNIYVLLFYQ